MSSLLYDKRDRVAYLTINRPEAMNAYNDEVRRGLVEAFDDFRHDPETWVAILTGAGERAFSAGADLKEMSERFRATGGADDFWSPTPPMLVRGMEV
jgi:enoyl-CoA hydratase/carnithine racemase